MKLGLTKPDHAFLAPPLPLGKSLGNFLKGQIPHPRELKKCETPTPGGRKIVLNPLEQIFLKIQEKTRQEAEIIKDSTEVLIQ